MKKSVLVVLLLVVASTGSTLAQEEVPVQASDVSVDTAGCIQIQVESSMDYYYVLYCRHNVQDQAEFAVSLTLGQEGTTTLTEQLAAYPVEHYRVIRYRCDDPANIDGDGIDDVEELLNPTHLAPVNPAPEIDFVDFINPFVKN